jgi:hypothetical protein
MTSQPRPATIPEARWVRTTTCEFPGCTNAARLGDYGALSLCFDHREQMFHDAGAFYLEWEAREPHTLP